ncbi:hypothetical protein [Kribbella sp. NBC_00359]|uniref:hypothetical protein n=1 Tax=Kribbella sp. NBC_00359 TaxID=2975966 RepID=UPI002E1B300C
MQATQLATLSVRTFELGGRGVIVHSSGRRGHGAVARERYRDFAGESPQIAGGNRQARSLPERMHRRQPEGGWKRAQQAWEERSTERLRSGRRVGLADPHAGMARAVTNLWIFGGAFEDGVDLLEPGGHLVWDKHIWLLTCRFVLRR